LSDVMKQLQAPFDPSDIEWRVGSTTADKTKGLALAYVTNRAIQNRLDEVFGPFGWQNEFREWKGSSQICGISVWDSTKNQWITKWDGADDSQTEAVKGGLSDSMKRAGYQWGIGRYLYNLPAVWVPIKQQGKSYVIEREPILPDWALPEGYKKPNPPKQDKPQIGQEVPFTPEDLPPGFTDAPVCADCKAKITQAEIDWCKGKPKYQGKSLCKACQKNYK
jgi:hypothetical protein